MRSLEQLLSENSEEFSIALRDSQISWFNWPKKMYRSYLNKVNLSAAFKKMQTCNMRKDLDELSRILEMSKAVEEEFMKTYEIQDQFHLADEFGAEIRTVSLT